MILNQDDASPPPLPVNRAILQVSNLRKAFGSFVAVDGLNLSVREGEIYGFLGVNGAGKTTAIRMLMGILSPDSGTIELMGEKTRRTSIRQKQKIGYVSQEQVFYPWMTPRMLGKFVGGLYPTWDKQEFDRLLGILEVPPNRRSSQLSGGMRVKLALALALAPRPPLLILDEPTAGLDPVARREFLDIIQHQSREHGRTTFFSTHLLNEVERAADRVGIIHRGRQRFEGPLSLLQNRVKRVTVPRETPLPAHFNIWRIEEVSGQPAFHSLVMDADPAAWEHLGWAAEKLSLDDIFISCVGVAIEKV